MIEVQEYIDRQGRSPFQLWFNNLHAVAAAKIATILEKIAQGNTSNVKGIGGGLSEYVLDWGPGYRIYFGQEGRSLVILLGGSSKKRQSLAIAAARTYWAEHKERKSEERKQEGKDQRKRKHGTH